MSAIFQNQSRKSIDEHEIDIFQYEILLMSILIASILRIDDQERSNIMLHLIEFQYKKKNLNGSTFGHLLKHFWQYAHLSKYYQILSW